MLGELTFITYFLPPANESLGQGNVFRSVCLSTGECGLPFVDSTSPRTAPPPDRTSPLLGQHPPSGDGGRAGGTHPTGMLSC